MSRLLAWLRWELGRPIEVTGVIRLIIAERFVKGAVLIVGGLVILVVANRGSGLHQLAENLQAQLNLAPGRGVFRTLVDRAVITFGDYSRRREDAIAVGAVLYGGLEAFEGVGLLRRRRWAEYLVLVATAAFLPLEIDEIVHHVTPLKVLALVVNLLIIGYLVWRKRLFLERPGHPSGADASAPEPR